MRLGRDIRGEWETASRREWPFTNGLGGYACGTIALANSRRYHAFLMASFTPPLERTLLVAKIDVTVEYLCRERTSPHRFRQRSKRCSTRRAYHSVVRSRVIFGPWSLIRGIVAFGSAHPSRRPASANTEA